MKRIAQLAAEPAMLGAYRERIRKEGRTPDWDVFRDEDRDALQELQRELTKVQMGLCAYCEIDIHGMKPIQIEHYLPKSGDTLNAPSSQRQLDYRNLLLCCMGGVSRMNPSEGASKNRDSADYWLSDSELSQSCGDAKGHFEPGDDLLDPRTLRLTDRLFVIYPDGMVHPDKESCHAAGVSVEKVESTIRVLRLNCHRLRYARQKWWETRKKIILPLLRQRREEPHHLRVLLGPNSDGWLQRFFSSTRYYLGRHAEAWLAKQPQPSA